MNWTFYKFTREVFNCLLFVKERRCVRKFGNIRHQITETKWRSKRLVKRLTTAVTREIQITSQKIYFNPKVYFLVFYTYFLKKLHLYSKRIPLGRLSYALNKKWNKYFDTHFHWCVQVVIWRRVWWAWTSGNSMTHRWIT